MSDTQISHIQDKILDWVALPYDLICQDPRQASKVVGPEIQTTCMEIGRNNQNKYGGRHGSEGLILHELDQFVAISKRNTYNINVLFDRVDHIHKSDSQNLLFCQACCEKNDDFCTYIFAKSSSYLRRLR